MENIFQTQNPVLAAFHREADDIQAYMILPLTLEDPASLTYRLSDLNVYLARLSDIMSRSKAIRDFEKNNFVAQNEEKINKMTATASNRLISTHLYEYSAAYDRFETMYHTLEVLVKTLITQISFIKSQMNLV